MAQDFGALLSMWNWDPIPLTGGALILLLYLGVMCYYRPKYFPSEPLKWPKMVCFLSSILVLVFIEVSPLDMICEKYLLFAHMIFHLALTNVAAPLMVLGLSGWWFTPILKSSFWQKTGGFLTNPVFAFLIFNINLLMWHYPSFYEGALNNDTIHFLEHFSFFATGVLFWWPILSPTPVLPRLPSPYQILYLFLASVPCTILGVVLVFSPTALYSTYQNAPRILNIDPLTDQVLSGVLMTTLDNFFYLAVLSLVFFNWVKKENKKMVIIDQSLKGKSQI